MYGFECWLHRHHLINPRRACTARVTVVVLCVCVCVCVCVCQCPGLASATHATTTRPSRHSTYGLSIMLAPELIWRFSYNGFVSKIAIALPYSRAHGSRFLFVYTRNGLIFHIPSVYYALDARVRELLRIALVYSAVA